MTRRRNDPLEPMKREIARQLGWEEIIDRDGWGGLTSAQAGKIGGIMARRLSGGAKERTADGSISGTGGGLRQNDGSPGAPALDQLHAGDTP